MTKEQILTDLYTRLTGRKFLTFVTVAGLLILDNVGFFPLGSETRSQLLTIAISYLVVQGGVDSVKIYKANGGSL